MVQVEIFSVKNSNWI